MKEEFESPVYHVHRVPVEKVRANSYNPNHVAAPEMKLLELSIWEDGYTMPCVCYYIPDEDIYELVDGYHRYCVLKTSKRVFEREKGLLPVVVIEKPAPLAVQGNDKECSRKMSRQTKGGSF